MYASRFCNDVYLLSIGAMESVGQLASNISLMSDLDSIIYRNS